MSRQKLNRNDFIFTFEKEPGEEATPIRDGSFGFTSEVRDNNSFFEKIDEVCQIAHQAYMELSTTEKFFITEMSVFHNTIKLMKEGYVTKEGEEKLVKEAIEMAKGNTIQNIPIKEYLPVFEKAMEDYNELPWYKKLVNPSRMEYADKVAKISYNYKPKQKETI